MPGVLKRLQPGNHTGNHMVEALTTELTDYALAVSYMTVLTISVTATLMVRAATFPLVRG